MATADVTIKAKVLELRGWSLVIIGASLWPLGFKIL